MSDYFIKHFIVIIINNEPDAKDAVLNEEIIQLLCLFCQKGRKMVKAQADDEYYGENGRENKNMMFRYVHINIIVRDCEKLIAFYKKVFHCKSIGETRHLRGDWK